MLDTLALRALAFAVPLLAVGAALDAGRMGWGLFNVLDWPLWLEVILSVLILDFAIWAQHLITHKVPLFWRFHRVHHADRDMDVTTAVRFHPVEILASMGLKIGLVYLLGPQALAVLLFEVLLNGTALFNHANIRLAGWLDRIVVRAAIRASASASLTVVFRSPASCFAAKSRTSCVIFIEQNFGPHIEQKWADLAPSAGRVWS